jgi:hypothetical protein
VQVLELADLQYKTKVTAAQKYNKYFSDAKNFHIKAKSNAATASKLLLYLAIKKIVRKSWPNNILTKEIVFDISGYTQGYCHSGSFCQLVGNPIAFISMAGYSASSDFNFRVNVLCGEMVKSRYLMMQIRKYTRFISVPDWLIHG